MKICSPSRSIATGLLLALALLVFRGLQAQEAPFELQVLRDSLFQSPQNISLIRLNKKVLGQYKPELAYHSTILKRTSLFAEEEDAAVAINGSFFDMNLGGSVTYLEKGDSLISITRPDTLRWAVPDSLANGAILLNEKHELIISRARKDTYYRESKKEVFVLVSGPLLIHKSLPQKLPDMDFTHKRHPRSCLGITEESLIFMTVDGRSEQAAGMNLFELQSYMLNLGCTEAINLDGGGSTTLWTRSGGVLNLPSDQNGERAVANAIIIVRQ